jgi:hypothetical protein
LPTDDIQRLVVGQATAPAQFTVPGNGQIQPKCVEATYDGTGAAAAFLPVLEFISDAGISVGKFVAPQVAAGGSADVSWFPHVAEATAAATGAGNPWVYTTNGLTVPYNGGSVSTAYISKTNFWTSTGDQTIFGYDDFGGGHVFLQLNAAGIYVLYLMLEVDSVAGAAGKRAYVTFTGATDPIAGGRYAPFLTKPGFATFDAEPSCIWLISIDPGGTPTGHDMTIQVAQDTGADQTGFLSVFGVQINPAGNPAF